MKQILLTIAVAVVAPFAYAQVAESTTMTTTTESSNTMTVTNGNDSPQAVAKRYDFNGDGYPDFVLAKPTTESSPLFDFPPLATGFYYLRNNVRIGWAAGPTITGNFGLVDAADVNRDGHNDYVLFNPQTRETKILFMRNNVQVGSRPGPMIDNGFGLQKVGDLNGDGSPDWVLFNLSTRQTIIWYMQGTRKLSGGFGPTLDPGWDLKAVADFDGDGHGDYLLVKFGGTSSPTEIWYIVNRRRVRQANGPAILQGYRLIGAADFNKDGHPDYLLARPHPPKKTAIWYLEDNHFIPPPSPRSAFGPDINPDWLLGLP
jgi:hypothetical protein